MNEEHTIYRAYGKDSAEFGRKFMNTLFYTLLEKTEPDKLRISGRINSVVMKRYIPNRYDIKKLKESDLDLDKIILLERDAAYYIESEKKFGKGVKITLRIIADDSKKDYAEEYISRIYMSALHKFNSEGLKGVFNKYTD